MNSVLRELDHIAIVVQDTEEALRFYRDQLRLTVVFSEVLEDQHVRLTHLDLGQVHLQLVQPLRQDHPLNEVLRTRGETLHHLCFRVPAVAEAVNSLKLSGLHMRDKQSRSAPRGRRAVFLDPASTRGILIEVTGSAGTEVD